MNLKEKIQELDDRVNKLDNLGLLTNGSFYVKATLQSLFIRVNAKDELGTLSLPFSLLSAISNLESRIKILEEACKHNYTFDWVYTYIGDRQHEKIKRCNNCNRTYGETITESCADVPKYIPVDGFYHDIKYTCTYCNEVFSETWGYCQYNDGSVCTLCGFELHSHSYTDEVTTPPSCESNGVKTWTCSCGDSYTEDIPSVGHSWATQPATCLSGEIQYCETCGKLNPGFSGQGALGHTMRYCDSCGNDYCLYCGLGHRDDCIDKI